MRKRIKAFLYLLLFFIEAGSAQSQIETYQLFKEKGGYASGYNQKMKEIISHFETGNTEPLVLQFSRSKSFQVNGLLGKGDFFNAIFDIGDGKVLRVRQTKKKLFAPISLMFGYHLPLMDSFYTYKSAYLELLKSKVPMPKSYFTETHDSEFLVQEKIEIAFLYSDYMNPDFRKSLEKDLLEKIENDLVDFAKTTARYHQIGDFREDNIVYDKKRGWLLLDMWNNMGVAGSMDDGNVFEMNERDRVAIKSRHMATVPDFLPAVHKPELPEHMVERVNQAILDARWILLNKICKNSAR
ncbi:MAG: hypothetical protein VX642_05980 [Bdellovibrionota bacterium]|nr:hypothetical protein [Bdellovibrionota bacterium]